MLWHLEIMAYFHKRIKRLVNDKILNTLNFIDFELIWIALRKSKPTSQRNELVGVQTY